jgi:hypothetical protein
VKIGLITILTLFVVLLFTPSEFSQKKVTRAKSTKKEGQSQLVKCPYSEKELDTTLIRLPKNYYGNDLQEITAEVIKRGKFVKGEFETTKEFQERIQNERRKVLTGELTFYSVFAFQDNGFISIKYDADSQRMNIDDYLSTRFYFENVCQNPQNGSVNFLILNGDKIIDSYKFNWSLEIGIEDAKL